MNFLFSGRVLGMSSSGFGAVSLGVCGCAAQELGPKGFGFRV